MSVKGKIVLNYYDSLVCEEDLNLLEGPFWLNDTIIGFYMDYLEHEEFNTLNVCYIRPEVTQCLKLSPEIHVFLEPIEFRFKSYAVMALNDCINPRSPGGSHWSLLVFCRDELKFYHLDSSEGTNNEAAKSLAAKISSFTFKEFKCEFQSLKSLQQTNSYDCGLFLLCNLENVLTNIFKKRRLSKMEPISEVHVSKKRTELKKLIINLHKREASKPPTSSQREPSPVMDLKGEGP